MAQSAAAAGRVKASARVIASSVATWASRLSPAPTAVDSRGRSATPIATPTSPSGSW